MDKDKVVKKILGHDVTIDELVITDRLDEWNCHTGQMHEGDIENLTTQICQLFPAKVKLIEKPSGWHKETMDYHAGYYRCEYQVKEALEKAGVEVEE